ncbi:methanol--corrinoid protein co-methyltransferase MtaB [Methanosalsum natronophilum]|uniref:Methanol--corrinoid methyltransferase n=1 Tax=Methanosalsum natronophilum TaxID=768733 RepID=A0A424YWM2_9EURY|nr:methanol--corrinoid protein co-methyltransferase MtaB [Methanosalsum natronophilum]MCS3923419.1 methanol--5-hydroxybenzimidazolylcobamide Co-methyltransferase [Methanosalsum natronophilum]RQD84279.1 MAG: methanol--corrinoid methyltransferase [Methanosalsum natronophilum]
MTKTKFTRMAYNSADDMVFGRCKKPIKTGFDLEIGSGSTIPEINYAPRPEASKSPEKLISEYDRITNDILNRMIQLGVPSVVLETEHVQDMTINAKLGSEIAHIQKTILEEFYDEYGIKCGLRHTIADIRERKNHLDLKDGRFSLLMECFDSVASKGADLLSIESIGGKEVFDYSILKNDFRGILYSIGCLGAIDVENLWLEITKIAKKYKSVPAGDTACSQANTAMFLAGGLLDKNLAHTSAAVIRGASASRSLVANEAGAIGPGKDCGYENVILKAVTGMPVSQCGKSSSCAHSDIMGNLMMQCCDMWSNESVEYHGEFGGMSVQCWGEVLAYDCSMLNAAIETGNDKILRDILMVSDRYRDPQGFILSYDNAYEIGKEITNYTDDTYMRTKKAALKCCNLLIEGSRNKLNLSRFECTNLEKLRLELKALTDDSDEFQNECLDEYTKKVRGFIPGNYF